MYVPFQVFGQENNQKGCGKVIYSLNISTCGMPNGPGKKSRTITPEGKSDYTK
jgi:hypothetical protein